MPDLIDVAIERYDWSKTAYAGYADSNLCHNILDGKAVTGTLHFVNQTPFDWYSKKQAAVETATYGAEELRSTGAYDYVYVPDKINPANILSKHWSYRNVWNMFGPIFFWQSYWGIDRTVGECQLGTIRCTCTWYLPT